MRAQRQPAPAWISLADQCYGLSLWLYSGSHRRQYGPAMRQAFRDRCREVARGEQPAFRVFAIELLPDLIVSLGREHMRESFGAMKVRQALLLGLLCVSSAYFLFGEAMGLRLSDAMWTADRRFQQFQDERITKARTDRLMRIAEPLAAEMSPTSQALATYLYRIGSSDFLGRPVALPAPEARTRVPAFAADQPGTYLLLIAARHCDPHDCNLKQVAADLVRQDPDNGYGWALKYRLATLAQDARGMRHALMRLAVAGKYDVQEGRTAHDLLTAAQRLAPGDAPTMELLASEFVSGGWSSYVNLRALCGRRSDMPAPAFVRDVRSDTRADCLQAGQVMGRASDLNVALRGWEIAYQSSFTSEQRDEALAQYRALHWLRLRVTTEFGVAHHRLQSSQASRVAAWIDAIDHAEGNAGEIPTLRAWLSRQGRPSHAPADFELDKDRQQTLDGEALPLAPAS